MDEQEEYLRASLLRDTTEQSLYTVTLQRERIYTLTHIPNDHLNRVWYLARQRGYTIICNACHQPKGLDPDGYCYQAEGKRCIT